MFRNRSFSGLWVWISRIVAALMVATVAGHAMAPVSAPLERVRGSAFSAATGDVSVLSDAAAIRKADAVAPSQLWVALLLAALLIVPVAMPTPVGAIRRAPARGPPDRALLTTILPLGPPAR